MRILIYATSPIVNSGYGVIARHVGPLLRSEGHDVGYFAWNTGYGFQYYDDMPVYPQGNTKLGMDILPDVVEHFRADLILVICDPWIVYPPTLWKEGHNAKVVFWMPIQAAPMHPQMMMTMQQADACLVYSKWGTRVAVETGLEATYMPLGVGPEYQELNRDDCRAMLSEIIQRDVSGLKVFGMVAANSSTRPTSRKAFDKLLMAFKQYQVVKGNGLLWLGTTDVTPLTGGVDIEEMANIVGLRMHEDIYAPATLAVKMGIPDAQMARFYNAFDVSLQTTVAEGFGLPIIEAQACGRPVITGSGGSQSELVRYGTTVEGHKMIIPGAPGGIGYDPDCDHLAQAMIHCEFGPASDAPARVREEYHWPSIVGRLSRRLEMVIDG